MIKTFFKKRKTSSSIQKLDVDEKKIDLINYLNQEISKLDEVIKEEAKSLYQVERVRMKATLSSENWFLRLQKKMYWSQIEDSASWHREQIVGHYKEKRKLQFQLDKLTGKLWIKQINQWLLIIIIILICLLIFGLTIISLVTSLYLIPIWAGILICYRLYQKLVLNKK